MTANDVPPRLAGADNMAAATAAAEEEEQAVTPWEVSAKAGGKIDYDKLVLRFGLQHVDRAIISRVERLTARPAHVLLRRGIFFAHRDFDEILDAYERGDKFYLYMARCPSSESLHLGHLAVLKFAKYLQDAFKVPLVIQLTDDELMMWKYLPLDSHIEECKRLACQNAKDIIACGFDITKTFIFSDFGYFSGDFYRNMVRFEKCAEYDEAVKLFGFDGEDHIGKVGFHSERAVSSFSSSFPHLFSRQKNLRCLIPSAIDQDAFLRMTRHVAPIIGYQKPASIESTFLPALQGLARKMSSSEAMSAIYVTDSAKLIKNKVNRYAFSGGQDSIENHRKYGADLEVDIPVKYLDFFLDDDAELEYIKTEYGSGKMLTGELKKRVIEILTEVIERHQETRASITDEMVDVFMAARPLPHMFA